MYTPNPNVDHLDPANWWPQYDMASDRRAIPATAALVAGLGDDCWWSETREEGSLIPLDGIDRAEGSHDIVLYQPDEPAEPWKAIAPDAALYVPQAAFERALPRLPDALTATFDALWAHHQAGRISRSAFDARAADLRGMRDHITKVLELKP